MKVNLFCVLLMCFIFAACSSGQIKESTYHALKDKECMDTKGYPNCDKDRSAFNEYEKQKEETLEK